MSRPTLGEIQKALSEKYIYMDDIIRIMYQGLEEGHNVILYGPPGHGKSELTKDFFELIYAKEQIFKTQFGEGTSLDTILGYLNVKTYRETGIQEYNLDVSFLAHKAAIFEELFNARPKILQTLIDILMSKEYCVGGSNGKVCVKMQTELIVACTNVDPRSWVASATPAQLDVYRAFNERFVLRQIVEWPSYTRKDYETLFVKVYKGAGSSAKASGFAEMCAYAASEGKMITPRTAVKALKSYENSGIKGLEGYGDIDTALFGHFKRVDQDTNRLATIKETLKAAYVIRKENRMPSEQKALAAYYKQVKTLHSSLNDANCPSYSDIILEVSEMVNYLGSVRQTAEEQLLKSLLS